MDFRQIEYFIAVIEQGSVSGAAKNLKMTQPPLSAAISKLEQDLGVKLLKRTSRGVIPTQAGMFFFERATRLLNERNRLKEDVNLIGEGLVGEIRVGVEPMVVIELIGQVMAEFIRSSPNVRVTLEDQHPTSMIASLEAGKIDLACVPFGQESFAKIISESYHVVTALSIDLKIVVPPSRADEVHEGGKGWGRWILPYPIPAFRGMPEAVESNLKDDPTFRSIYVSTPQTAIPLVAAGIGVAPVTERMARGIPDVAVIDPPEWLEPMRCSVLWRKGAELTPLMNRWLEATALVSEKRWGLHK
ncbi:LysR family transcriptional regulator [Micrococcoides hystricis]|uniref:LysR family transcriptional regulator n=1 Tax=Micrococcoides hystricis TaxID=1572761 RepID=A0ABV6PET4_9MICC